LAFAQYWGRDVEGGKGFQTIEDAEAYLLRTLSLIFPEHTCTAFCGPTSCCDEVPEHVLRPCRRRMISLAS